MISIIPILKKFNFLIRYIMCTPLNKYNCQHQLKFNYGIAQRNYLNLNTIEKIHKRENRKTEK